MKVTYLIAALALLLGSGACGDNIKNTPDDAPVTPDSTIDAPVDAPPQQGLASCIDRPTDLPRPPTGALSCDMLPPGLVVTP